MVMIDGAAPGNPPDDGNAFCRGVDGIDLLEGVLISADDNHGPVDVKKEIGIRWIQMPEAVFL
jgi:hypothetical protein